MDTVNIMGSPNKGIILYMQCMDKVHLGGLRN